MTANRSASRKHTTRRKEERQKWRQRRERETHMEYGARKRYHSVKKDMSKKSQCIGSQSSVSGGNMTARTSLPSNAEKGRGVHTGRRKKKRQPSYTKEENQKQDEQEKRGTAKKSICFYIFFVTYTLFCCYFVTFN